MEISGSVLSVDKENAIKIFYNLETAKIDYFHIDVMDGEFVENNNLELMKDYSLTISQISNIGLDVHLMVKNVEEVVDDYLGLNPRIITFHIEALNDDEILKVINLIKTDGVKVGIAISPDTEIEKIIKFLPYIHQVVVMTVVPGKGGQKLIPETIEKIKFIKNYIDENNLDIDIEADGGINKENSKILENSGANILVVGSYLINSENYNDTVKKLKG